MAMTLRLTDDDARRLRAQADREGTSMHEVALSAVRDRVTDNEFNAVLADVTTRYRSALDELADL